ncbi:penicillin-binding protein 1C [Maridesulfovibrio hydrothermalis]|uniref:peptidoglycan glycosyltransferase n=1 Tax=Maridesulfovibrio hydrothermalis AM13 = DSM 14728 TaxID=1121451 RepID=L0R8D3_9BACT|nr:penicillin-binding protein 1C [Maridesulfovibrio hydrothermalis]CCO22477.1 Penicillin-binding protein 1C [Maridesulfovibrio hydrothermalis AM13 = DSM 14728]
MGRKKKIVLILGQVLLFIVASFLVLDFIFPFPEHKLHRVSATIVKDNEGNALRIFLPPDGARRMHTDFAQVSPTLKKSLIASEDSWFEYHPGVNPVSIIRAAIANIIAGRIVSGASTIPMQIARMAEPKPRTLSAKLQEAFRAMQLKLHHSNDKLLEIYLNILPYGSNIEGVAAASYFYFGHDPSTLSLAESALLTTLPRGPVFYDPIRHPQQAAKGRNRVMLQLEQKGEFPSEEVNRNLKLPLPDKIRPVPLKAPHFCRMVLERSGRIPEIKTTLDYPLQQAAQDMLATHVARLRGDDIDNAACVIIHIPTRQIRALVGSADFFEKGYGGAINLAETKRSPGSTLKPFIYALAFDQGKLTPDSFVYDIPVDYSGYSPENYNRTWSGQVTVKEALARSLNIPAVNTLAMIGVVEFSKLLQKGGISTLNKTPLKYGLPLALGGCEIKLTELTNLYASLADGGKYRPLTFSSGTENISTQLLSPEAAWLTLEMLSSVARPDMNETWMLTRDMPEAAWKTGTSFGHRDAWAVGISGDYAIGVWVGNPDGRPRKGISGAVHAGPLLFDLLRMTVPGGKLPAPPEGSGISEVKVCAHSRRLVGPFCSETTTMRTLSGKTRLRPCKQCRQVFVDAKSGYRLSGECLDRPNIKKIIVRTIPTKLARWRAENNLEIPKLPPPADDCDLIPAGIAPKIISPAGNTPYLLRKDTPLKFQQVALKAEAEADGGILHWFLDGRLVAKGRFDEKLFTEISTGTHRISVSDALGRTDSVIFKVK